MFRTALTWSESKAACLAQDANLAIVGDIQINQFMNKFGREFYENVFWIGAYQNLEPEEVGWMWVDGSNVSFEAWGEDEPNGCGDCWDEFSSEDCALFWPGGWNDNPCDKSYPYVCEKTLA